MKLKCPIITVAGHVDHGKCVSGDTLIPLSDGSIITARELFENNFEEAKAERLDDGMVQEVTDKEIEISSFDGKNIIKKTISHIWKKEASKLIEIKTSSGDIIKTTPEHPFFTFNFDNPNWKEADLLKEGDFIAVPKKIIWSDSDIRYNLIEKIKKIDNFVCNLNSSSQEFLSLLKQRNISEIEKNFKIKNIGDSIRKKRFRIKDFFILSSFLGVTDADAYSMIDDIKNANEGWRVGHTSKNISLPNLSELEKLGYLLGCLAGDGYISNNAILNNNDSEIQESYRSCLKEIFNIDSKVKQAHTCQIVVDNGGLTFARFIIEIIGFPASNKSGEIFVPEIAKKNKEVFKGFFAGLFDTDGYVSHINNSIELTSKSKRLIKECSILLLNFGIHSAVYKKNGFFVLRVANKIYLQRFIDCFNPRLTRKSKRIIEALSKAETSRIFDFIPTKGEILKKLIVSGKINKKVPYFSRYIGSNSLSNNFLENVVLNIKQENEISEKIKMILNMELSYVKIISKKEVKNEEGYVYDFTVPETHNFIAERILVHNTTLLDSIRKTGVAEGEAGGITQKISFTLFPADKVMWRCPLLDKGGIKLEIPGFLFIDTPGHAAFTNLRKRGGSLADLAIVVIDINEGIKPQTAEVIEILKLNKTPFVVALNKLDRISGWRNMNEDLKKSIDSQAVNVKNEFMEKMFMIQGALHSYGFNATPYYDVKDFTIKLALVPCSGKTGEGIPELLMILCGLSQKFLRGRLALGKEAKGVILEVKKEKSSNYIEAILYDGELKRDDEIAIASFENTIKSKIRVLEEVLPLSSKFKPVFSCGAATGIRMQLINQENVLSGMPFQTFKNEKEIENLSKEVNESIEIDKEGIVIKAESLGSLEALMFLLKQENIKVSKAGIGPIKKSDIITAQTTLKTEPLNAIILGFNVEEDEEAKELAKEVHKIKILKDDVIYKLIENLQEFRKQKEKEMKKEKLMKLASICKLKILQQYVFHNSNPAIFGVAVEGGILKQGIPLIDNDGLEASKVKAVQSEGKRVNEAKRGQEVALSLPGVNFERQLKEKKFLYSDIGESQYRQFKANKGILSQEEISILQEIAQIKRKDKPTWGV